MWRESTSAQLSAQGLDEVDDPYFQPRTQLEEQNYISKNKWVYAVLLKNVQTQKGRYLVLLCGPDKNAAQVLLDLDRHHHTSAAARLRRGGLIQAIINTRLDGTWKRSQMDFILSFRMALKRYNDLAVFPHDILQEMTAKTHFQNAVHNAPNLRDIAAREVQDMAVSNSPSMDLEQYLSVAEAAASLHDAHHGKSTLAAHHTDLQPVPTPDVLAPADNETEPSPLSINVADATRPRLPDPVFKQLSQAGKRAWTGLQDSDRTHFLNAMPRSVNVHDVASTSDFSPITEPDNSGATASTSPSTTGSTSVNSSRQANPADKAVSRDGKHPADPRRLLSQPTPTKSATKPTTRQTNTVTFSGPTLTPYEAKMAMRDYWSTEPPDQWHDCQEDF